MTLRNVEVGSAVSRANLVPIGNDLDRSLSSEADIGHANNHHLRRPSSSGARSFEAASDRRKRPSTSTDSLEDGVRTKEARSGAKAKDKTGQRAAHACLRCRKQKLRCLGGKPCERCVRSSNVCDFGQSGGRANIDTAAAIRTDSDPAPIIGTEPLTVHNPERDERLKLLETSVANLLAGLAEESDPAGQGYPNLEIFHEVVRHRKEPSRSTSSLQTATNTRLPPPTHVRPLDPIRFGTAPINPSISPSSTQQGQHSISPAIIFETSPHNSSYNARRSLDTMLNQSTHSGLSRDEGLPATESLYEAPFRSLVRPVSDVCLESS